MAHSNHAGTLGHAIGASIISDKGHSSPSTHPDADGAPSHGRISIEPCDGGGCTVEHTPIMDKSAKKSGDTPGDYMPRFDSSKETKRAFTSSADAHAHVTKLMKGDGGSLA